MNRPRAWLISLAAIFTASAILSAAESIVKTKDGRTLQGDVKDRGDSIAITIHGVDTIVAKADVAAVQPAADYGALLRDRLAALPPNDAASRVALSRDALNHQQYDIARQAAQDALAIDPNNADAAQMIGLIDSQTRLERNRTELPPPSAAEVVTPPQGNQPLLTEADVESIRRKELQRSDIGSARIRFDGDVKLRYAQKQNLAFAQFNQIQPVEQALEIFDRGDDDMKEKVHVVSDPATMMVFRRQIEPLVLRNCATSGCHGGPPGGGLVLITAPTNELTSYTNFYILQSFSRVTQENQGGVFGGASKRLIDRGHGEPSLLPNYGLPVNIATYDHPLVNNRPIQPLFRNKMDERYMTLVSWINALGQIDPDYGIKYTPPSGVLPATQPDQKR